MVSESPVSDAEEPVYEGLGRTGAVFFHVPVWRLVAMSILSAGIYQLYWIFKNSRYLKERDKLAIHPFWRAVFAPVCLYGLVGEIHDDPVANKVEKAEFPEPVSLGWILATAVGAGALRSASLPTALAFPLAVLFLVPIQRYINRVNAKLPAKPRYFPWSIGHFLCLAGGFAIWFQVLRIAR